jgi:hypothetical protein
VDAINFETKKIEIVSLLQSGDKLKKCAISLGYIVEQSKANSVILSDN